MFTTVPSKTQSPTLPQALFLMVVMPVLILLFFEVLCRVLNTPAWFQAKSPQLMDMPTWMQREESQAARSTTMKVDANTLEWLQMFEEGPGFRVRLVPSSERAIFNTFSKLPSDKQHRYIVKANSLGFRGSEPQMHKSPGVFRVLVFGDSSSFGWGVNQEDTFSSLLEQSLSQALAPKNMKAEVLNFAIPGDSSEYGRLIFDTYAATFDADLVILGFGANDAKRVIMPHQKQVEAFKATESRQKLRKWAEYSALYRTLTGLLTNLQKEPAEALDKKALVPAVSPNRYRQNLLYMTKQAQKLGHRKTLILTLCTPGDYAQKAQQAAQKKGALFLNGQALLLESIDALKQHQLLPEMVTALETENRAALMENDLFYVSSDACHPNAIGNRIVAQRLNEMILSAENL